MHKKDLSSGDPNFFNEDRARGGRRKAILPVPRRRYRLIPRKTKI